MRLTLAEARRLAADVGTPGSPTNPLLAYGRVLLDAPGAGVMTRPPPSFPRCSSARCSPPAADRTRPSTFIRMRGHPRRSQKARGHRPAARPSPAALDPGRRRVAPKPADGPRPARSPGASGSCSGAARQLRRGGAREAALGEPRALRLLGARRSRFRLRDSPRDDAALSPWGLRAVQLHPRVARREHRLSALRPPGAAKARPTPNEDLEDRAELP